MTIRSKSSRVGTGITVPLGVVCDGALFGSPAILKIEYRYVRGL